MSKLLCCGCKTRYPEDTMLRMNIGKFHSMNCFKEYQAMTKKKPVKKKAKPKRKKLKTLPKLSEQAAELTQKLVRMEASDDNGYCSCVTCGVTRHYKDGMQGGHFISRRYKATKLMKENIHPQCAGCNGPLKGNLIHYTLYMVEMYGKEFIHELERLKAEGKKWNRQELDELITQLNSEIRFQSSRIVG